MVTTGAVLHGPRERLLGFSGEEHPLAVQLGGSNPADLAAAAQICADIGYDEINLNVGCPSDRVQEGRFGACLMLEPALVGDCVAAMRAAVDVPITVKCRIGVDEQDSESALDDMADAVVAAGAAALIVHARKAWLKGLSPKENRDVPPLDYERVYRLKRRLPGFPIVINGGINSLDEAEEHLRHVDGIMLGRAAYQNPGLLADVDARLFGSVPPFETPRQAAEGLVPYIESHLMAGGRLSDVTRHMLGLFPGRPGARAFRRYLATWAVKPGADARVLLEALDLVRDAVSAEAA
jgi:tRNA-dihydrouridine synthase A